MQVGYPAWVNPISAWLGLSFLELGLKELQSFTSGTLLGWSWLASNLDPTTQTRSSSETFLRSALKETPNLTVYKSTLAKRILFKEGTAKGVVVESGGLAYNLTANKEVILSAGVVSIAATPKFRVYDSGLLDAVPTNAIGLGYRTQGGIGESGNLCTRRPPRSRAEYVGT